jgi:hypothetical protein
VSDPVTYTAVLSIIEPTAEFLAKQLAGERARRGTCRGRRALGCHQHGFADAGWADEQGVRGIVEEPQGRCCVDGS